MVSEGKRQYHFGNDYIDDQQSTEILEELRTEINSLKVQQKKILELLQHNHEHMK
jgi:hypothetical protein